MKFRYIVILVIVILILIYLYLHTNQDLYTDYVMYIPNFLDPHEYHTLLQSLKKDSRPYDINKNGYSNKQ